MKNSINLKIGLAMMVIALLIVGLIGIAIKFVLPDYYLNKRLERIEGAAELVVSMYDSNNPEVVVPILEELENAVGGQLYYDIPTGQMKGFGNGRNSMYQKNNSEKFIPSGEVTTYTYTDKSGLEIYVLGVMIDVPESTYLVYEVDMNRLDSAVGVILEFLWLLLIISLVIALFGAVVLSTKITKPIKALNNLAKAMQSKKVAAVMVTESHDEIGTLNHSLNNLYEALQSNIYRLESELSKERESEKLKKVFLAQATHELKTPIAVIRGYAEILYDGMYKNEDERDTFIKNIYDETEAISRIILDVLDYSKMESGSGHLEMSIFDPLAYFEELLRRFGPFVEGYGLKYESKTILEKHTEMVGDKQRIEQVVKNLLANAVEHGKSVVKITIDKPGEKIRISVFNDGPRIDDVDMPYLFDSFYKKKGKKAGTGLGLAIIKEIVERHGGEYRVENMGNGVLFVISI